MTKRRPRCAQSLSSNFLRDVIYIANRVQIRPLAEALIDRRLHWLPRFGIAHELFCTFFAVKNFSGQKRFRREVEKNVGFFARLGARWLD